MSLAFLSSLSRSPQDGKRFAFVLFVSSFLFFLILAFCFSIYGYFQLKSLRNSVFYSVDELHSRQQDEVRLEQIEQWWNELSEIYRKASNQQRKVPNENINGNTQIQDNTASLPAFFIPAAAGAVAPIHSRLGNSSSSLQRACIVVNTVKRSKPYLLQSLYSLLYGAGLDVGYDAKGHALIASAPSWPIRIHVLHSDKNPQQDERWQMLKKLVANGFPFLHLVELEELRQQRQAIREKTKSLLSSKISSSSRTQTKNGIWRGSPYPSFMKACFRDDQMIAVPLNDQSLKAEGLFLSDECLNDIYGYMKNHSHDGAIQHDYNVGESLSLCLPSSMQALYPFRGVNVADPMSSVLKSWSMIHPHSQHSQCGEVSWTLMLEDDIYITRNWDRKLATELNRLMKNCQNSDNEDACKWMLVRLFEADAEIQWGSEQAIPLATVSTISAVLFTVLIYFSAMYLMHCLDRRRRKENEPQIRPTNPSDEDNLAVEEISLIRHKASDADRPPALHYPWAYAPSSSSTLFISRQFTTSSTNSSAAIVPITPFTICANGIDCTSVSSSAASSSFHCVGILRRLPSLLLLSLLCTFLLSGFSTVLFVLSFGRQNMPNEFLGRPWISSGLMDVTDGHMAGALGWVLPTWLLPSLVNFDFFDDYRCPWDDCALDIHFEFFIRNSGGKMYHLLPDYVQHMGLYSTFSGRNEGNYHPKVARTSATFTFE